MARQGYDEQGNGATAGPAGEEAADKVTGRFTPAEDVYIKREWKAGTMIRRMVVELRRERSSVCDRIKQFQQKGELQRRPRYKDRRELHLRIDPQVSSKIEALALARGRTLSKYVEFILRNWVPI